MFLKTLKEKMGRYENDRSRERSFEQSALRRKMSNMQRNRSEKRRACTRECEQEGSADRLVLVHHTDTVLPNLSYSNLQVGE